MTRVCNIKHTRASRGIRSPARQIRRYARRRRLLLHSPVASVDASFDTLDDDDVADDDESSGVGAAGIGDLCVLSTAVRQ